MTAFLDAIEDPRRRAGYEAPAGMMREARAAFPDRLLGAQAGADTIHNVGIVAFRGTVRPPGQLQVRPPDDVDRDVLPELIAESVAWMREKHG